MACSTYRGEERCILGFFVRKPEGKRSLERHRRRWEDNIKIDFREVVLGRGFLSGLLSSGFYTQTLYDPILSPYVLHVLPISVFLIWLPK
jgi:hypothetical protein